MKRSLSLLAFLLLAASAHGQPVIKVKAVVGELTPIVIENDQAKIVWSVLPSGGMGVFREYDANPKVIKLQFLPYRSAKPVYSLVVATANGELKQRVWEIEVEGGNPVPVPPGPGPGPGPPPVPPEPPPTPPQPTPASAVGIVLVKDPQADDPETLTLLARAYAWARQKGHVAWPRLSTADDAADYVAAARADGAKLPALVFIKKDGTKLGKAVTLPDPTAPDAFDKMVSLVRDHGGLTDSGIQTDDVGDYILHGGVKRRLSAKRTTNARMKSFAKYSSAYPLIPTSKWRDFSLCDLVLPRILDQNGRGACVGHGSVGAYELSWRFNAREHLEFCPWFTYGLINGGQDGGAYVGDSLTSMQERGVALWGVIPYSEYRQSRFPKKAFEDAKRFRPDVVYSCTTWEEVVSAVTRGHPVVFGCQIGSTFSPDSRGVIPAQRGGGGGHCMFVAGIRKIEGQWFVHVVNSWGLGWGVNGTCFMPKSYFDDGDLADAYAIVSHKNDPQDPSPLPRLKLGVMKWDQLRPEEQAAWWNKNLPHIQKSDVRFDRFWNENYEQFAGEHYGIAKSK